MSIGVIRLSTSLTVEGARRRIKLSSDEQAWMPTSRSLWIEESSWMVNSVGGKPLSSNYEPLISKEVMERSASTEASVMVR